MSQNNERSNKMLARYAGLTMQIIVLLGLGIWSGIKLDGLLAWKFPLFTILLPLFALAMAFWQLIKSLNNRNEK